MDKTYRDALAWQMAELARKAKEASTSKGKPDQPQPVVTPPSWLRPAWKPQFG